MSTSTSSRRLRTGWLLFFLPALALSLTACDDVNPFSSDASLADVAEAKEGTIPGDQIYEGCEEPIVVFWHGAYEGAMAYRPVLEGEELDFTVQEGEIVDDGTGSTWTVDGRATSGPMSGKRLEAVPNAYTAFWFAWAGFQPDTEIWTTGG